jgi:uracil phosphoribosyltransferase
MVIESLEKYPHLQIITHPFLQHKLTIMRNAKSSSSEFRSALFILARLLAYHALSDIKPKEIRIETPVAPTIGYVLPEIVIVPILRAGLGMANGVQDLLPEATQGHIGMYRDSKTKKPIEYLCKLPEVQDQLFLVVDPMLATGGTAIAALEKLIEHGVKKENIRLLCIVTSPEGIDAFYKAHPNISIYTTAFDEKLNDKKYIIPGLGDCGDRLFGTL